MTIPTTATLPVQKKVIELDNSERTRCEIWSRVMGYHRPVTEWNPGKQQEFADRRMFEEKRIDFI